MSGPCTQYLESMSAYIDGELPEEEARALDAHLTGCPPCRLALEELRAGDEKVRAAAARVSDSRPEDEALERALARLREEPAPAWAAAHRRARWNWSVTLRWSAGLAAAAAGVLLFLRLGPTPTAPFRPRVIPPSQQERVVAAPAPPLPAQQVGERPQEIGKAKMNAPARPTAPASRDDRAESAASAEKKTVRTPAAATPAGVAQADREEGTTGEPPSSAPAPAPMKSEPDAAPETRDETAARGATPQSAPPLARAAAPERTAPSARNAAPERSAAKEERTPAPSTRAKDGSVVDRVKSTLSGDSYFSRDGTAPMRLDAAGVPPPWYMTVAVSDTVIPDRAWKSRLQEAETEMASRESAHLPADERARRYRAIGDLWEWFGRTANDPLSCVHALASYRLAVESDPEAAALDSTRVQRARAAVAGLTKVTPAYR
jgi:hypothetical protein